ncbi:MAG: TetR/AcrR family transcriptional regulator [Sneathiellales bacterium]|nr:TetR/AcrR family transcriptional regulator [Sneathiellales bacterium]
MLIPGATSRKTPLQARSKERVEKIISSAEFLLKQDDLSQLTTSRIAARAGIPVGSIYQYFKDRDEILLALGNKVLDDEDEKFTQAFQEITPHVHWKEAISGLLSAFHKIVREDDTHYRLDIALSDNPNWQKANLLSEKRIVELLASYPLFDEKGLSEQHKKSIAQTLVITVSAIIFRSKSRYWTEEVGHLVEESRKMVTAYLDTVFES